MWAVGQQSQQNVGVGECSLISLWVEQFVRAFDNVPVLHWYGGVAVNVCQYLKLVDARTDKIGTFRSYWADSHHRAAALRHDDLGAGLMHLVHQAQTVRLEFARRQDPPVRPGVCSIFGSVSISKL